MIKPILYERIEQKKEIEREMFSKLSTKERAVIAKEWMAFLRVVSKVGRESRRDFDIPHNRSKSD